LNLNGLRVQKNPDILIFTPKTPGKPTPPGSPKTGFLIKREDAYRAFAYLSKERCPTTTALLHPSIKVPGKRAPPSLFRLPLGDKGVPTEIPLSGDLPNVSSRVPSEGAPPRPPPRSLFKERERETLHPPCPLQPSLKVPSR